MELELGFKITHARADHTSTSNLSIAKDRAGPVFVSTETDAMFILTAHLNGYTQNNVNVKINEDGSRITISGQKPVQEIVMKGWMVYKKDVEMRGFAKTFRIPDGVVLDKIKAKFNDDDSVLTILMPKLVKGMVGGVGVEEVGDEAVGTKGQEPEPEPELEPPQAEVADDEVTDDVKKVSDDDDEARRIEEATDKETQQAVEEEKVREETFGGNETTETNVDGETLRQDEQEDDSFEEAEVHDGEETVEKGASQKPDVPNTAKTEFGEESEKENQEASQTDTATTVVGTPPDETEGTVCDEDEDETQEAEAPKVEEEKDIGEGESQQEKKKCKLGIPIIIAGSAILVSLFVYVVHSIRRSKKR